ncbi:hypothetical protein DV515_00001550 [Chloebia gouldiae]|uniref:Uncharacterized protein n=1 Tax=Chloebia gouldiae TaxID=44316 RepID=A0A3L8SZE7_CHLGU|nr:hypothetical protein DV515_00001550 [Chloebia gouldiae]
MRQIKYHLLEKGRKQLIFTLKLNVAKWADLEIKTLSVHSRYHVLREMEQGPALLTPKSHSTAESNTMYSTELNKPLRLQQLAVHHPQQEYHIKGNCVCPLGLQRWAEETSVVNGFNHAKTRKMNE